MQNFFWVMSNKNSPIPVLNYFIFRIKSKYSNNRKYWRCIHLGCSITLVTIETEILSINGDEHFHSNHIEKVVFYKLKEEIKKMIVQKPYASAFQIYVGSKRKLDEFFIEGIAISRFIPSFESFSSNIYRWKMNLIPYCCLINSESFDYEFFKLGLDRDLLLHVEFEQDLLVILGEKDYIEKFSTAHRFKILMDGTFKSSSTSFYQVYIIHGFFSGQSFPLIYCFMNEKTERLYTKVFNIIKEKLSEHGIDFSPQNIQIDFERAGFNSLQRVFPETSISGCFFHFGQAIWRRVQKLGLVSVYHENINFKNCVQLCSSLALVPMEEIDNAWAHILSLWPIEIPGAVILKNYI
ncbi:hypothetical protein DMUE_3794, partial [Dictyocoela muelleri]